MRAPVETLGALLDRNASLFPDRCAIAADGATLTYGELLREADRLARGFLAHGVGKGDRVALLMDNRPEWISTSFALARLGAVLVPINIRFGRSELDYVLAHSEPKVLVFLDRFRRTDFVEMLAGLCPELLQTPSGTRPLACPSYPSLRHAFCLSEREIAGVASFRALAAAGESGSRPEEVVTGADVAHLLYTSGTTASPKGVMLTHANVCLNGRQIADRIHVTGEDRSWVPIPLFFSFGCVTALVGTFVEGACLVLQREFDPEEALRLIERERCSLMFATPNMYLAMLDRPSFSRAAVSTLRSGSIMGTSEQIRRVVDDMGVPRINTGYGMTETSALCALTDSEGGREALLSTAGRPFPGVSVAVKDPQTGERCAAGVEGEIRVKGYNVTRGYYKDPARTAEAFDEEGYLRTGDLGVLSEEGYLSFRGRLKDMYKTGGINVSTLEVETFLQSHPSVLEAAVVSIPDPRKDEVGVAFVKLRDGAECTPAELLAYCKARIAGYKIPKEIHFVTEFPLTGSGKVQKFRLRETALRPSPGAGPPG